MTLAGGRGPHRCRPWSWVDREYSVSTSGCIVLACHFGHSSRMKASTEATSDRSLEVLRGLVAQFCAGGPLFISFFVAGEERAITLVVEDGRLPLPPDMCERARRYLATLVGDCMVDLAKFLIIVYAKLRQSSRLGTFAKDLLSQCFQILAMALEAEAEASNSSSEVWMSTDHLALPVLRRDPTSSRCRRLSPSLKILCSTAVAEQLGIRIASQLVAAKRILGKRFFPTKAGMGVAGVGQRNGAKHLWFTCDGCRVSNLEMLVVAVGDPTTMLHGWVAPQAGPWDTQLGRDSHE